MNYFAMLMAEGTAFNTAWHGGIKQVLLAIMVLCALFIILVVMFQPGNSNGVSALGGSSETFYGKNKSKTFEHKMKIYTVISGIVFTVLAITFAIIAFFA